MFPAPLMRIGSLWRTVVGVGVPVSQGAMLVLGASACRTIRGSAPTAVSVKYRLAKSILSAVLVSFVYATVEGRLAQHESLALIGGRVYPDPNGPPIEDSVVLLERGTIAAVGARTAVAIPAGTTSIDCNGLVITAGLRHSP